MKSSNNVCVIIAAAGKGMRAQLGCNKALYPIDGVPMVRRTAEKFAECNRIIVACSQEDMEVMTRIFADMDNVMVVHGGSSRTESVKNALAYCDGEVTLVHDAARPDVSKTLIGKVIEDSARFGSAVPCLNADVAMKKKCGDEVCSVLREEYLFVQTPQGYNTEKLKAAYNAASGDYSDDSEVWEKSGESTHVVLGEAENVKYTYLHQFKAMPDLRTGTGYDVHALEFGRKLILGGVEIHFEKGLAGHSDADVLTHAVMDALLSAAGLPDIGVNFPDTDESTLGISSMVLLAKVMDMIKPWRIVNLSAVVMAEKPRLSGIIPDIRASLAAALGVQTERVNVSATTTEKLGIVGEGKGMAATATVLLERR